MKTSAIFKSLGICALLLITGTAFAEEPVARLHQVNARMGLVVHSSPGIDGTFLHTLDLGTQVTLAGTPVNGDQTKIVPVVRNDSQDPGESWVQITAPFSGYVLYHTSGAAPSDYLLPCHKPVARMQRVNAPVGLVVRSTPGTDGKRLGNLKEGTQVSLAGASVDGDKNQVVPVISKDARDPDASWIQIATPKAGYVLYRADGASPYEYLVLATK